MTTESIAPPAPRVRVPFWDNARFLCIVLVIAGHALQPMSRGSDVAYGVYVLIYTFHMPAFAIMSGYFSSAAPPTRARLKGVLTDLVLPFLIFETIWQVLDWIVSGTPNFNYSSASWTLWFLLALAAFRIVLPYLALLRWPVILTVIVSIYAGYISAIDGTFALNRTFQLMPFFVIGWWLKDRNVVARLGLLYRRSWTLTALAAALMAAVGVTAWLFADTIRGENLQRWLFYSEPYQSLKLPDGAAPGAWGGLIHLGVIVFGVLMCAAFFLLVPRGDYRWTQRGRYTLYVYLLHTFVLFPLRETNGADGRNVTIGLEPDWLWVIVLMLGSVLVAILLSSRPIRWLTRPLIEPRVPWLFTSDADGRPGSSVPR